MNKPTSIKELSMAIVAGLKDIADEEPNSKGYFDSFAAPKKTKDAVATTRSIPSRYEIAPIVACEKEALCFLERKGVIQIPRCCPLCHGKLSPMSRSLSSSNRFVIRCRKRSCSKYTTSVLSGSILSHCKFNKAKFVDFCYQWVLGISFTNISTSLGMSPDTVTDWGNYLREAVAADILLNDECQIGGPGIIVEIDESKFGKRKYHVRIMTNKHESMSSFLTVVCTISEGSVSKAAGSLVVLSALNRTRIIPFRKYSLMERSVASEICLQSSWRNVMHAHLYPSSVGLSGLGPSFIQTAGRLMIE